MAENTQIQQMIVFQLEFDMPDRLPITNVRWDILGKNMAKAVPLWPCEGLLSGLNQNSNSTPPPEAWRSTASHSSSPSSHRKKSCVSSDMREG